MSISRFRELVSLSIGIFRRIGKRFVLDVSSDWIRSRPISFYGEEGQFAAEMYRPSRHEQYISQIGVCRLSAGVGAIVIEREDLSKPLYRIENASENRSIAFTRMESKRKLHG